MRAQEGRRDDRDPVLTAVRAGAGMYHRGIYENVTEVLPQPDETPYITISHAATELHLQRQNPPIGPFHDQIPEAYRRAVPRSGADRP